MFSIAATLERLSLVIVLLSAVAATSIIGSIAQSAKFNHSVKARAPASVMSGSATHLDDARGR